MYRRSCRGGHLGTSESGKMTKNGVGGETDVDFGRGNRSIPARELTGALGGPKALRSSSVVRGRGFGRDVRNRRSMWEDVIQQMGYDGLGQTTVSVVGQAHGGWREKWVPGNRGLGFFVAAGSSTLERFAIRMWAYGPMCCGVSDMVEYMGVP